MSVSTDSQKIKELLTRGVEHVYPTVEFLERELKSGRQLTLYTGYDPTAPTLHIGHGITMLKLREFQNLGHKVIFLIGDFTGMIGDPTDKSAARQKLTREQVLLNCKLYKEQAATILDFAGDNPVEVRFNGDWLSKLTLAEVLELTSNITVDQMLQRDMFRKRREQRIVCPFCKNERSLSNDGVLLVPELAKKELTRPCDICKKTPEDDKKPDIIQPKPIYLHEFLYPLMQGYDSVAMGVDGEVGGNDQTFNMLVGRDLMKIGLFGHASKEKFVVSGKLLVDTTGKKMGKTEGNAVTFFDTPEDMFGKIMRWNDEMIISGFEICTRVSMNEITAMEKEMKAGSNPRDFKFRLAFEITKTFLGEVAAKKGQEHFETVIQDKEIPTDIPELKPSVYDIVTVLVESKLCPSKGEARRSIEQGGVKVNEEKIDTIEYKVKPGDVVQKGKRFFVRVK